MTRLALLLGDPVAHSLSPLIHNTAFRTLGLDAVYHAVRTPAHALAAAVEGLRADEVLGANLTIPHKEAAVDLVDTLDETAAAIGAINTVVKHEEGRLSGHNTDVGGFLDPLRPSELKGCRAVVIGSGGAARAVTFALVRLAHAGMVTIVARRAEPASTIVQQLARQSRDTELRIATMQDASPESREADLIVNATPIGMGATAEDTPVPAAAFRPNQIVYDLVYSPRPTRMLKEAAARGARTIDGLEMLIAQAATAFQLWTGREMPREAVRTAILNQ